MKTVWFRNRLTQVCDRCLWDASGSSDSPFSEATFDASLGDRCTNCNAVADMRPSDLDNPNHLYNLSDAVGEIKAATGARDTTIATTKLAGKTLANAAVIGGKFLWRLAEAAPGIAARLADEAAEMK